MIWAPSSSFVLVAVPLFLLMGEILLRCGLSDQLYRALNVWLRPLAGRPAAHQHRGLRGVLGDLGLERGDRRHHGLGRAALLRGHETYNQRMVLGSLAAGGALGNLIPPGITFIVYGLITETSVGKLYIAAIGPSILVVPAVLRRHLHPRPAPRRTRRSLPPTAAAGQAAKRSST